jgi:hypothetical protein
MTVLVLKVPGRLSWILPTYKPGSVECFHSDGHSSRNTVTCILEQPTRSVLIEVGHLSLPIWPCSCWGLPCRDCYQSCGELLPHRFTLACMLESASSAVCFLLHFPSMSCDIAQELPGSMPDGARTFLEAERHLATVRSTVSSFKIAMYRKSADDADVTWRDKIGSATHAMLRGFPRF